MAEYDTSSIDETKIAAFQAGTTKTGAMYGLLFLLAQFHLDVAIAPLGHHDAPTLRTTGERPGRRRARATMAISRA